MKFKIREVSDGYDILCNPFWQLWFEITNPKSEELLRNVYDSPEECKKAIQQALNCLSNKKKYLCDIENKTCNCKSWFYSKNPKTCKHLKKLRIKNE